jgi:cytoskeletal protein RodZ
MKYCPNCRTNYTDDSLQFCLQDGSVLASYAAAEAPPTESWNEPATVVRQKPGEWEQSQVTRVGIPPSEPKKSNMALVIFLTFFATLVLVGLGLGAWFLLRNNEPETAVNTNANLPASNSSTPSNTNASNLNTTGANTDTNRVNVINVSSPTPTRTPNTNSSVNPTPTVNEEQVKSEVAGQVAAWKSALESGDMNNFMGNYADRLDYYFTSRNVGRSAVSSDKQRAFSRFYDFRVKISNLRVTPDQSGEQATAVFDKEWEFEGSDHRNAGKVQSQLQLTKIGGRWLITGERDLKVYYVE